MNGVHTRNAWVKLSLNSTTEQQSVTIKEMQSDAQADTDL